MEDESSFRFRPRHLLPALCVMLLVWVAAYSFRLFDLHVQQFSFFADSPFGTFLNAVFLVGLMGATGTTTYVLTKRGCRKFIVYLMNTAIASLILVGVVWYNVFYSYSPQVYTLSSGNLALGVLSSLTAAFFLASSKKCGRLRSAVGIVSCAILGLVFGIILPITTMVVLMFMMSAYDIFAVSYGPIGRAIEGFGYEAFSEGFVTQGDLCVGVGDLIFYATLTGGTMINLGPASSAMAGAGTLIGVFAGLKVLERRSRAIPGLPLALGLGLLFTLVSLL